MRLAMAVEVVAIGGRGWSACGNGNRGSSEAGKGLALTVVCSHPAPQEDGRKALEGGSDAKPGQTVARPLQLPRLVPPDDLADAGVAVTEVYQASDASGGPCWLPWICSATSCADES